MLAFYWKRFAKHTAGLRYSLLPVIGLLIITVVFTAVAFIMLGAIREVVAPSTMDAFPDFMEERQRNR